MVRVVHAGDFHLDSAFGALTPEQARQRRMESRRTPERLVEWANDHGADLLLLKRILKFIPHHIHPKTVE